MPSPETLSAQSAGPEPTPEVFAAAAPAPEPERKLALRRGTAQELGVSGLDTRNGLIYREYNFDLRCLKDRMKRFEEMRRSESAIAVMEQVIYHPLRSAEWRIEPGEDADLAEHIERNLFEEMTIPWGEIVRQAALAILYGFTIQEKVFEEKPDGFVGWRKFAERDRQTVYEWAFDRTGGLKGFKQRGYNPATGVIAEAQLPIDKLLVWTWRPDAGDPEGLGVLRQAYKPYSLKQAAEQFGMIRIERQACGMPVLNLPPDALEEDRDECVAQIRRLRTGENTGMALPDGYTLDAFQLGDASVPFGDFIERQHQYVLQCALAQFIGLGQGDQSGTNALSKDTSSMFVMALEAAADWIAETFNRYAIAQVCYLNVADPGRLPRLTHGPIGVRDLAGLGAFARSVFGPNAEIPPDIEVFLREQAGMPETSVDSIVKFREASTRRLQKQKQAATQKPAPVPAPPASESPTDRVPAATPTDKTPD